MDINKKAFIKKVSIILSSILGCLYLIFLILPFGVNPFINKYCSTISSLAKDVAGLDVALKNIGIVTTPKLTAGVKAGYINVKFPSGEELVSAKNAKVKVSLLPLIIKRIELDVISADSLALSFGVDNSGKFQLEDYISDLSAQTGSSDTPAVTQNPLGGFILSNHLPDIRVEDYQIRIINSENSKESLIDGKDFVIKDFILDKKVKVSTNGEMRFLDRKQITYDVKIFNKIMPDIDLNDMLFNSVPESGVASAPAVQADVPVSVNMNILTILDGLSKIHLSGALVTDLKISGKPDNVILNGIFNVSDFTFASGRNMLPKGHLYMTFKNKDITLDSELFTGSEEKTSLSGIINHGRKPLLDLNCKSNLNFAHLLSLVNHLMKSFGIEEYDELAASGTLNADFRLKSDLKTVLSDGYLSIPEADNAYLKFKPYNVSIENIFADVDFSNNMLNLKNAGFSVADNPLKIYGTVKNDSSVDLHLLTSDIMFKSLVALAGQADLLKDNDFKSGTVSIDASLGGKLNKLLPVVDVNLNNLMVKNIPSATSVELPKVNLSLLSDGNSFEGLLNIVGLRVVNPMAVLSMSDSKIEIDEDNINILTTYLLLNDSSFNFSGTITDYMTDKLAMNITGSGNILATDIQKFFPQDLRKSMPAVGSLPLSLVVVGNSKVQDINLKLTADTQNYISILDVDALKNKKTIINSLMRISDDSLKFLETGVFADSLSNPVLSLSGNINHLSSSQKLNLNLLLPKMITSNIPGFINSTLSAKGDIFISGTPVSPVLKGDVIIPLIKIPDIDFTAENLVADVNGPLLCGYATLKKFQSGGIVAENLAADFGLKNYDIFYLKNITGDAFGGTISGSLAYGLSTAKTALNLSGKTLDAEKAIQGAAGIKNALSGKLDFNAQLGLRALDFEEMMKSLTGSLTFDVSNGTFGNIGRFDTFIGAPNINSNKILSGAVSSVSKNETLRKTADFALINGNMAFDDGWADISSIKVSGPYTSYYVSGRYNLLNGTTNVIILGRLASDVVTLLGPLGELSVDKLTENLPKFGLLTSSIIKAMTTNPDTENVALIPDLTTDNAGAKEFKVEFNGGVDSPSAVKSFKWLAQGDTSDIKIIDVKQTAVDVKNQLNETKDAIMDDMKNQIDSAKDSLRKLFSF